MDCSQKLLLDMTLYLAYIDWMFKCEWNTTPWEHHWSACLLLWNTVSCGVSLIELGQDANILQVTENNMGLPNVGRWSSLILVSFSYCQTRFFASVIGVKFVFAISIYTQLTGYQLLVILICRQLSISPKPLSLTTSNKNNNCKRAS